MDTPFDERVSHHEGREGHEDRITERASNKKNVFFLRALRALRGDIHFSLVGLGRAECGYIENWLPLTRETNILMS
jgi:hypothetical protein